MEGDFIKVNNWLLPLSWVYGLAVRTRNMLFDMGVLKHHSFAVPIISVGNITVGGTGKTPHVEYLLKLLQEHGKVAVLSRGYRRKTSGFVLAGDDDTARTIGDEPYQIKQKFPQATVAVDKDRVRGIKRLLEMAPDMDVILLDDAFQHRYVKPGINILLVDYHRLIIYDKLLPAGRLREPLNGKDRADVVIVTKCPKELKPMEFRVLTKALELYPYQSLYFTTFEYDDMQNISDGRRESLDSITHEEYVMLLTGIASPRQLTEDLTPKIKNLTSLSFPDHHDFSKKDIRRINQAFDALPRPRRIITTEKDAARLAKAEGLSDDVLKNTYVLPVHVCFMLRQETTFNENILGYVRKNSRNSILAKGKDGHSYKDVGNQVPIPTIISFR